jgi:hypothetical protein
MSAGDYANKVRYKVLRNDLTSPYNSFQYELDRWYHEPHIGDYGNNGCQVGLYAGSIEALLYRGVWRSNEAVYRCRVKGRQAGQPPLKECWEYLQVVERVEEPEVRRLAKRLHKKLGYNLTECLYPIDPLRIERGPVTDAEIQLLREWAQMRRELALMRTRNLVRTSVWDSVQNSKWNSVWDSVGNSVWGSVRRTVGNSVWDSVGSAVWDSVGKTVWDYIGSLFPNIQQWCYMDCEPGVYPFRAGADLWRAGLVPSFDGTVWRLHSEPQAKVVWEGKL